MSRAPAGAVPRYTSYPTAPHFHAGIGEEAYVRWLGGLAPGAALSLYVHVPFCDTLCWFCGCSTKMTRRYAPVAAYLRALEREIALASRRLVRGARVRHLHWGGGSPTMLEAADVLALSRTLRSAFDFAADAEFAVEVDPRGLDGARLDALAAAGLTRASVGVQDFDPAVQAAINRLQGFEETRAAVDGLRSRGVRSLNVDAIYGLPGQTVEGLLRTIEGVLALAPDRIALFGYAHVPWMKRHQAMIDAAALPGADVRLDMARAASARIAAAGFVRIGLDHFARPKDPLARAAAAGLLRRNFQGYVAEQADALLGLGASAIGSLPGGYVQNVAATGEYARRIAAGRLPIARGYAFGADDLPRRDAIERLMCDLRFDAAGLRRRHGEAAEPLIAIARTLVAEDPDGAVLADGEGFRVTESGRAHLRSLAARFDAHLAAGAAGPRHTLAV